MHWDSVVHSDHSEYNHSRYVNIIQFVILNNKVNSQDIIYEYELTNIEKSYMALGQHLYVSNGINFTATEGSQQLKPLYNIEHINEIVHM